jgi:hypothetical protein
MTEYYEVKIKLKVSRGKLRVCNGGVPTLIPSTLDNPYHPDTTADPARITWKIKTNFWRFQGTADLDIVPTPGSGTTAADVAAAFSNITVSPNGKELSVTNLNAHGGGQKSFRYKLTAWNPSGQKVDTDPGIENLGNDVVFANHFLVPFKKNRKQKKTTEAKSKKNAIATKYHKKKS